MAWCILVILKPVFYWFKNLYVSLLGVFYKRTWYFWRLPIFCLFISNNSRLGSIATLDFRHYTPR